MVMTLRNFILLISIVCISSLSACAQTVEKKQGSSTIGFPSSDTINSTATQGSASQNQPANLPASLPQQQELTPVEQKTAVPDVKLNQFGTSSSETGTVSPPGSASAPTGIPGPLAPQQVIPPLNQPTLVPERMTEQQRTQTGQAGKIPPSPPINVPVASPAAGASSAIGRGAISLNFDDADIYSVIQTVFSEILKLSYIIDPRVKGRVTFRSIAPVPRDNVLPLMEVILRLNGVAVIEDNGLYRIIPISDLAREPAPISIGRSPDKIQIKGKALLQVIPIQHMQSAEVVKLLAPFVSTSAVIVDVPKSNHIIIVDTDASVKRLLELINFFDSEQQKKKGPQVFVYHVQNGKAKDIGALLQQIFLGATSSTKQTTDKGAPKVYQADKGAQPTSASQPSTPPAAQSPGKSGGAEGFLSDVAKIFSDEILNAIIVLSTPEDYNIIRETIVKLDIIPRQVLIEGAIAQVQLIDSMSLGIAWALKKSSGGWTYFNPGSLISDPTKLNQGLNYVGIDSGGNVTALINALASESKAKLLASPHIMVSDNREAKIQVGQQVPIATSETFGTPGVAPQQTIQYQDIGIILKVKPQINDSGLVAMDISQEVSTFTTQLIGTGQQVVINKTMAATNLVVQDGQTIVIGGMIREDDNRNRQGIPFLYKIPVLGYLFGNTERDNTRTELVILLTPHVVKNQQAATSITNKLIDSMSDEQMSKKVKEGIQPRALEQKGGR
jgi:general secretion pathway protein D